MLRTLVVLACLAAAVFEGGCAGPHGRSRPDAGGVYSSGGPYTNVTPARAGNPYYAVESQPVQAAPQPLTPEQQARRAQAQKILKQGLVGAGIGAISAEASGGKAGTGALVGAGTQIIGGALMDALNAPAASAPPADPSQVAAPAPALAPQPQKRIVRKFDAQGNVVSEEEVWD